MRFCFPALSLLSIALMAGRAAAQLRQYETRYYTIYTDIDPDEEKEAAVRMTKMAQEYRERTKGFSREIPGKLPFYLFKSAADYYHAGGRPGTSGVFIFNDTGSRLMAIAGKKTIQNTWHTVQHEGFHQFAHAVIGDDIPVWLNEGLADYFAESIFTGDGFVTGPIPPWRLTRLKAEITAHQTQPFQQMMALSPQQWQQEMSIANYDQVWSMVHFLVHGDDQKYQQAFADCLKSVSNHRGFDRAWQSTIGPNDRFEDRWKRWWLDQPPDPTPVLYARAAVATMTSFIARASAQIQTFKDFEAFHQAVLTGRLKIDPADWLPGSLLSRAFENYESLGTWSICQGHNAQPEVCLSLADGTRLTGTFELAANHVEKVNVEIDLMAVARTHGPPGHR